MNQDNFRVGNLEHTKMQGSVNILEDSVEETPLFLLFLSLIFVVSSSYVSLSFWFCSEFCLSLSFDFVSSLLFFPYPYFVFPFFVFISISLSLLYSLFSFPILSHACSYMQMYAIAICIGVFRNTLFHKTFLSQDFFSLGPCVNYSF